MPRIPPNHEQVSFIAPSDLMRELRILAVVNRVSIKSLIIEAIKELLMVVDYDETN